MKKVFLEISQNSQAKKGLWHRCLPVNFAKFLRTPFLKEHLWWLLLKGAASSSWFLIYFKCDYQIQIKKHVFEERKYGCDGKPIKGVLLKTHLCTF